MGRAWPKLLRISAVQRQQLHLLGIKKAEDLIACEGDRLGMIPDGQRLQKLCKILYDAEKQEIDTLEAYKERCSALQKEIDDLKQQLRARGRSTGKGK